jgi:hypothetical protein
VLLLAGASGATSPCAPPNADTITRALGANLRRVARPRSYFLLGYPAANAQGDQSRAIAYAIQNELGLDARCIKVVILEPNELKKRHQALGGRSRVEFDGFHRPVLATAQTVFIKQEHLGVRSEVLVHEVLHAMSQRFTLEATPRRSNMVEGLTEYFTREVSLGQLGLTAGEWEQVEVYGDYVRFAARLASIVGKDRLRAYFFEQGFKSLERAVDGKRGTGALRRAAKLLQEDDLRGALATLGPRR